MAYVPPADGFGDWATPKLLTAGPFYAQRVTCERGSMRSLVLGMRLGKIRKHGTPHDRLYFSAHD